jgi:hypothetical protein
MRPLPSAPVFTIEEAFAAGWSHSALRNAVRRGRIVRLRRGVYTALADQTTELAAIAAVSSVPRSVVSHRSAAMLHGLPLLGARPSVPELTVPPRTGTNYPRVHLYRAQLRPEDVTSIGNRPVTSVARTVADLGRHRPLGPSVAAIDAALHLEMVTVEEIDDVLRFCRLWPRIRRAERALRLADGRAESPLESLSRLVFPILGIPRPEMQKHIFDRYGRLVGRADFYWDEFGVAGEADGRSKYDGRAILTEEKQRQEAFENLALVVVRWGWQDVTRLRHVLKTRVENGFERGRLRDAAGFPRLWTL